MNLIPSISVYRRRAGGCVVRVLAILFVFFLGIYNEAACSSVIIQGTRIVMNAKENESTVHLDNMGKEPALVQLWLDAGNPETRPGELRVPFILTPPLARIEPSKGQTIRIMSAGNQFPADRESVFWFNMLEIPPKVKKKEEHGNKNHMQIAVRSRIKMFYRPDNLPVKPSDAYKEVRFSLSGKNISVVNDTPYYITFRKIAVSAPDGKTTLAYVDKFPVRMLSPKSNAEFPLKFSQKQQVKGAKVIYGIINDFGSETINEKGL